jgi:hypothetical protein
MGGRVTPGSLSAGIGNQLSLSVRSAIPFLLVIVACSSTVEPLSSVTLQVRNATCEPGPCQAIRVLAFPQNQPLTPAGLWSLDLGVVTGATACITLPPSAHFNVTDTGSGAVTVTTWTTGDSLSLGPWAPTGARFTASPTTPWFVAGNARSWSVTLPGNTAPLPAQGCTP